MLGLCLLVGLFFLSMGISSGFGRAAAIEKGMTANQYSDWVDDIN